MGIRWFLQEGRLPPGMTTSPDPNYVKVVPKIPFVPASAELVVEMMDAPDVAGTDQIVGFRLKDYDGEEVDGAIALEFAVFDDQQLAIPAQFATLHTATLGSITGGENSAALKVQTDSPTGQFFCHLACPVKQTVWLGCSPSFGSPDINCTEIDAVTFL